MAPPNAIARSYFVPDHLQQYFAGDVAPLSGDTEPSVAFCGIASPLQVAWSKTRVFDYLRLALTRLERVGIDPHQLARRMGTNMKHACRARQIQLLQRSTTVTTDFIMRASGGMADKRYYREDAQADYNTEYFLNIRNSLYTLCSRGTENYAIRFYETLCLGRIPIIVDTELVLPFASEIDYDRHCVIIPQGKTHLTEEHLLRYHSRHGPRGLQSIQDENRQLWYDKLSVSGFYANLPNTLIDRCSELSSGLSNNTVLPSHLSLLK
jgi:hypothetical protein